ncbi:hypothetical protein SPFM1_00070 [Salmonella phage SPFM1]|nr:hypothetical protein SPFM1_00070 [Salmonella phage SPFM1]
MLAHELADTSQHGGQLKYNVVNEVQRVVLLILDNREDLAYNKGVIKHLSDRYSCLREPDILIVLVSFHAAENGTAVPGDVYVEINGNRGMIYSMVVEILIKGGMLKVYSESLMDLQEYLKQNGVDTMRFHRRGFGQLPANGLQPSVSI